MHMASEAVNNYITKRYERWLDYSLYHCGLAGISDEATDVLNEVICSLLQKQSKLLDKLHPLLLHSTGVDTNLYQWMIM